MDLIFNNLGVVAKMSNICFCLTEHNINYLLFIKVIWDLLTITVYYHQIQLTNIIINFVLKNLATFGTNKKVLSHRHHRRRHLLAQRVRFLPGKQPSFG